MKKSLWLVGIIALTPCVFVSAQDVDRKTISIGDDPSFKLKMRGRAANLELSASDSDRKGSTETEYQKGRGFVDYDRDTQTLDARFKINYTLNRMSKVIRKRAPYMKAQIPRGAEMEFDVKVNSMGYATLDFSDLNIRKYRMRVQFGDVDVTFPTENKSIIRDEVVFGLAAGDLEIYDLANLRAKKIKINGGVGELSVDFGAKILQDTSVKLDMDIGSTELIVPRGTKLLIRGTSRNLEDYGMEKVDKIWQPVNYSPNSPTLEIKVSGPLGDFTLTWRD